MLNSFFFCPHVKAITFLIGEVVVVVYQLSTYWITISCIIMFLIALTYFEFPVVKPALPVMLILFLTCLSSVEDFNLNLYFSSSFVVLLFLIAIKSI